MHGPHESATTPCHLVLDGQLNAGHGGRVWSGDSTASSQSNNANDTDCAVTHARCTWYARSSHNARCTGSDARRTDNAWCPCGCTCRSTKCNSSSTSNARSSSVRTRWCTQCYRSGASDARRPRVSTRRCTSRSSSRQCNTSLGPANCRSRTAGRGTSRCSRVSTTRRCPCSAGWRTRCGSPRRRA